MAEDNNPNAASFVVVDDAEAEFLRHKIQEVETGTAKLGTPMDAEQWRKSIEKRLRPVRQLIKKAGFGA